LLYQSVVFRLLNQLVGQASKKVSKKNSFDEVGSSSFRVAGGQSL
jgi:hypothetical protein